MEPYDLMPRADWEVILRAHASQVRMTSCLTDAAGNPLCCQRDRYPLCAAIRADKQAMSAVCSQVSAFMTKQLERTLKPVLGACDVGLVRLAIPVVRDGCLVGQVSACGLASEDEEVDCFLISRLLGIPEEEAERLARITPVGLEKELALLGERLHGRLNPLEMELPATA